MFNQNRSIDVLEIYKSKISSAHYFYQQKWHLRRLVISFFFRILREALLSISILIFFSIELRQIKFYICQCPFQIKNSHMNLVSFLFFFFCDRLFSVKCNVYVSMDDHLGKNCHYKKFIKCIDKSLENERKTQRNKQ